jgi:hypothetical protein
MRLPLFFVLASMLGATATAAEEGSTRIPIGTMQMRGWGAAQPPTAFARSPDAVRRNTSATQVRMPIGTLLMTGRAQPAADQ